MTSTHILNLHLMNNMHIENEIGSEFHSVSPDCGYGLKLPFSGHLVFSGRTAIETVLKEIPDAKRALLPSYCCDSMIQPFRDAGIEVNFYPVFFENGMKVNISGEADIIFLCNYFGFSFPMPDLSGFNAVIIEDITHSLFSLIPYNLQSHYLVASLRKWEPINCGGYCAGVNSELSQIPIVKPPEEFIKEKSEAMELKAKYLSDFDETKKSLFLSLFRDSNHWFASSYSGLSIDDFSRDYISTVDMDMQRFIRRRNADILYKKLKGKVTFLFAQEDMDCPLFVPILLPNRDDVRHSFQVNRIYCPVHWPKPDGCESNLYDQELSLICDQRYSAEDMERIVSVIEPLL